MLILGLDPGLGTTGWGLIRAEGNRLQPHRQRPAQDRRAPRRLPERLSHLATQLEALIADHAPEAAAVEEVFVNKNPQSTLKLGQARGVVLMVAARAGLEVGEYAARLVKKAVVGTGGAEKAQVHAMVQRLLPGVADRRPRRRRRAGGRDHPRPSPGQRAADSAQAESGLLPAAAASLTSLPSMKASRSALIRSGMGLKRTRAAGPCRS